MGLSIFVSIQSNPNAWWNGPTILAVCMCSARYQRKKGFANAHLFATYFDCHTYKSCNRFNLHVCIMMKHVFFLNSIFFGHTALYKLFEMIFLRVAYI